MSKEKLFSITQKDFRWSYTRGSGKGGQKKNKTSSAVHCSHDPSGAHGYSEDTRSQSKNKQQAFLRAVNSDKFQKWLKIEIAKANGKLLSVEETVQKQMKNVKVEIRKEGRWVEEDVHNTSN